MESIHLADNPIKDAVSIHQIGGEFLERTEQKAYLLHGAVIVICEKGSLEVKVNLSSLTMHESTMLVLLNETIFTVMNAGDNFSGRCVYVPMELIGPARTPINPGAAFRLISNPLFRLDSATMAEIASLIDILGAHADRADIAGHILHTILLLARDASADSALAVNSTKTRSEEIVDGFLIRLMQDFRKERSVQYYADAACVTRKHLSSCVKNVTGKPAQEIINRVVIYEAKRLLLNSKMTVSQISSELGFLTPSSFVRFFHIHTSQTPQAYRRKEF